jgi:hypothetical protein
MITPPGQAVAHGPDAPPGPLEVLVKRALALLAAIVLLALLLVPLLATATPPENADAAVRAPVEAYLRGHATGDGEEWRKAFHPAAMVTGLRDGKLVSVSAPDFIARAPGKPAADEALRKRRIVSIDVSGDAAVAKVELDYPKVLFVDYLSLLRIDGEWKIAQKTYTGTTRKAP